MLRPLASRKWSPTSRTGSILCATLKVTPMLRLVTRRNCRRKRPIRFQIPRLLTLLQRVQGGRCRPPQESRSSVRIRRHPGSRTRVCRIYSRNCLDLNAVRTDSRWDEYSNHTSVSTGKSTGYGLGSLEGVHDSMHVILVRLILHGLNFASAHALTYGLY